MGAVDLAINLRYPPTRASSGVLHQLLQLGVPTLISDVVHWREYPEEAVARIPPGPDEVEGWLRFGRFHARQMPAAFEP